MIGGKAAVSSPNALRTKRSTYSVRVSEVVLGVAWVQGRSGA
jgi:hypothetical protein